MSHGGQVLRPSERSLERWKVRHVEHPSVDAFLSSGEIANGVHTILGGESPIDLLVRARRGRPIVFSFHGNTPRSSALKLPVFTGLNVTGDLDVSLVALSDPTLHLDADLRLAWFAGSARLRLQAILPAILARIAQALEATRVMFFGGSGGGFAALHYAADFPDSLTVVWNPQTDLRRYNPSHVEEYGRAAFGWTNLSEARARLPEEVSSSLLRVYAPRRDNMILYLQNNSDGHVAGHMQPFLTGLGVDVSRLGVGQLISTSATPSIWVHLASWGEGHASPPADFLSEVLRRFVDVPEWRSAFSSGRLDELIGTRPAP